MFSYAFPNKHFPLKTAILGLSGAYPVLGVATVIFTIGWRAYLANVFHECVSNGVSRRCLLGWQQVYFSCVKGQGEERFVLVYFSVTQSMCCYHHPTIKQCLSHRWGGRWKTAGWHVSAPTSMTLPICQLGKATILQNPIISSESFVTYFTAKGSRDP